MHCSWFPRSRHPQKSPYTKLKKLTRQFCHQADLCVNVMTILVVLLLGWGIDRDYDKYVVSQVRDDQLQLLRVAIRKKRWPEAGNV